MRTNFWQGRPCDPRSDVPRILELVWAAPESQRHTVDLPYRLASWALDAWDNTRVWEDAGGRLLGFAIVQGPWSTVDYGLSAAGSAAGLEREILRWGAERGQTIADRRRKPFTLYIERSADGAEQAALLEAYGFSAGEGYEVVRLAVSLSSLPVSDQQALPTGFVVRPLHGDAEARAYMELHRAAFGTLNMTLEWRQRTLLMPGYTPETDLVTEAPDSRLAAFCINWLSPDGASAQVEPCGVHPDFQRHGLGRALLQESFRRLAARGVRRAWVETYAENDPARALYEAVGFRAEWRYVAHARTFKPERERKT